MTARDDHASMAERFEAHRAHLRGVAYRMLGSLSDADDAVQEAWLGVSRSDTGDVENLAGWLTTLVARISLDMLRARKARREESLGFQPPHAAAPNAFVRAVLEHVLPLATEASPGPTSHVRPRRASARARTA